MTTRLLAITGWLALGHAVLGGLFWLLLHVPESNILMLGVSALIVMLIGVGIGWIETTAVVAWQPGRSWREAARRAILALPFFFGALALSGAIWWLTGLGFRWAAGHRGEIDAWLMAHWGWTRTAWIHAALGWLLRSARYALGASLAVTLVAAGATGGWRAAVRAGWLRQALAPRQWILVGLALLLFVWLPWQAVDWRPSLIPVTWIELLFVGVKLAVIYLVLNLGWALALASVVRRIAMSPPAPAPPDIS
jgi:hypothetical protein